MTNLFSRFVRDESGATAIEYGLIAALIAVVIIGAVTTLGTKLSTTFSKVALRDEIRSVRGLLCSRPFRGGRLHFGIYFDSFSRRNAVVIPCLGEDLTNHCRHNSTNCRFSYRSDTNQPLHGICGSLRDR